MRRSPIIALCIINGAIAIALLAYALGANKWLTERPKSSSLPQNEKTLDDNFLIERATSAHTQAEAVNELSLIKEPAIIDRETQKILTALELGRTPSFKTWPFASAILNVHGARANSAEELIILMTISIDDRLPLYIRESAFRAYIDNIWRFRENAELIATSWKTIKQLSNEQNSLATTSLQAENIMRESGLEAPWTMDEFASHLANLTTDSTQPFSRRLCALQILAHQRRLGLLDLRAIFSAADTPLKTEILRSLSASEVQADDLDWLRTFKPTSPAQETLLYSILGNE